MPPHPPPKSAEPPAPGDLADLLTDVATGRRSIAEALIALGSPRHDAAQSHLPDAADSPDRVTLDLDRQRRCGFPEVIYGAGKPAEMIVEIIRLQQSAGQPSFATRVDAATADTVLSEIPAARFNPLAKTISTGKAASMPSTLDDAVLDDAVLDDAVLDDAVLDDAVPDDTVINSPTPPPHVAVVTAGSTDAPVAEEAIETLHWMGLAFRTFDDIGVAGPQRLLAAIPRLRQATAVVVIAGMEGALPAAVGGHLDSPIFAVPTSVGYGATLGGLTPLFGMLSSCASNVAVVNIDAGFKAAYLAGLVVRPHVTQTTHATQTPSP